MKRIHDPTHRNEYELSTGRKFSANGGIIGLGAESDDVSEGYDGDLRLDCPDWDLPDTDNVQWTPAEKAELADYMIALWTAWRDRNGTLAVRP